MPAIAGSEYQNQANNAMNGVGAAAGAIGGYGSSLLGAASSFTPVLGNIASYGSAIPISTYVGQAAHDTQSSYGNALGQMQRNLSRMGVNPNSGRYTALQQNWGQALAAANAGVETRARSMGALDNMNRMMAVGQMGLSVGGMGVGALGQSAGLYGQQAAYYGDLAGGAAGLSAYTGTRNATEAPSYQSIADRELAAMRGAGAPAVSVAPGGAGYYPLADGGAMGGGIDDRLSSFSEARARNALGL